MKNYSKQREAIIKVLRSSRSHPTAASVYEQVREIIPNISLGTVYRNLSALAANGDILSVSVGDGYEHFDGDISPHIHLHCRQCGAIIDVPANELDFNRYAKNDGFTPDTTVCIVYGICKDCKRVEKN